ncbi:MAG: alkaline phosphatase family protein, partial [Candidatus Bathyarchaeia archaeon]
MARRAILLCIDGCGPEYLRSSDVPTLNGLGRDGISITGNSIVPSVTNVNNVSIITGKYPEEHGITSNYFYDPVTGKEVYMESPEFIRASSILEQASEGGLRTALLTSKDKLRTLLSRGASTSLSAERPPSWLVGAIGPPPPIYSVDVDIWLIKALREVVVKEGSDLAYVATTDYAMHMHRPDEPESRRHMGGIDRVLGGLMEELEGRGDDVFVGVTADHGMRDKGWAVNLELVLKGRGVPSKMNPIIKDRYTVHHRNLGGAAYVYLEEPDDVDRAVEFLRETEGVEAVLTRGEAAETYHLDREQIGDLLALGEEEYVFGLLEDEVCEVSVRSHGSLHEARIPIIANRPIPGRVEENK